MHVDNGKAHEDWKNNCTVPVYNSKADKSESANYKSMSLLGLPGKLYGRVVTEGEGGIQKA